MKKLIEIIIFLFCSITLFAQQLPYSSQLSNTDFVWNPAQTAVNTDMKTTGFFRQQWLGFDGAPRTAFVGLEYPFLKSNMSGGGALISDKVGPINKFGAMLNYSYKLQELIKRDDQLSIGISASFTQFTFDPAQEIFNDSDDLLLSTTKQSQFYPSIGAGFYYINNVEEYYDNAFFVGFSASQAYATNLLLESGNFERAMHLFGTVGAKVYGYDYMIEPKINLNVVNGELVDILANVTFEMEEVFWAGMGFSTSSEFSIQGGAIFPDLIQRDTELRIGALANIGVGNDRPTNFGPGFELFVAYLFDVD